MSTNGVRHRAGLSTPMAHLVTVVRLIGEAHKALSEEDWEEVSRLLNLASSECANVAMALRLQCFRKLLAKVRRDRSHEATGTP